MRNKYLDSKEAGDIDHAVSKVLRDLGNPNPPVRLELVLELLKLDLRYYSAQDTGFLGEVVHRITLAGKQILARPAILGEAIRNFDLKALYLPDSKRILLNSELPSAKQRWNQAHETVHSLIPWHAGLMLGDTKQTLSPACHETLELEANYGAGRLLFMQDRFSDELKSNRINLDSIKGLSKTFGNTITSTLWRAVEHLDVPAIGIVSEHPHHLSNVFNRSEPLRYFIRSKTFESQFSNITEDILFDLLGKYCSWVTKGPLGRTDVRVLDVNGDAHVFHFESFHNSYETLTLAMYKSPKVTVASIPGDKVEGNVEEGL